ncbi:MULTISPECIES: YcbK family protein [Elizabethkingia]|uniref:YcbK family protein n=1 Tax=Elizabethkingia TaxID=308865 RepID=UPI00084202F5|nr:MULTISPECIES: D-Ala-D-Ala carboxypeptidase family metallohydrolase [Elizabethkingia]MDE5525262.1 DUF882 domain-containing protein [Elizabethkingia meningoseptica]NHQ66936.1 DUF882 domain-containing protein [Elizabethkingia miricola]NHQ70197.1 DUF882 domain-containing protein [Elizabethkingia miricola]NHQ77047.1 DUF882 domain-containing protein [Elizabethkingia miricola]ODM52214.1 hypothetical protein BES09_15665 [Elizabethkingia meningoseptica]
MRLTNNFKSEEFACHDGNQVPEAYIPNVKKVAENLQVLRDYLGKPITVNSGYRSPSYNKRVGGAPKSQHLTASAADIRVPGMTSVQVRAAILELISQGKMHNGGLGLYDTFVHYDIRKQPTRWDYRKQK